MAYYGRNRKKSTVPYKYNRYINKPVRKALKVVPKKKTGKVAANRRGIYKLSKQVNSLQLAKLGSLQWNFQSCVLEGNITNEIPKITEPLAFCFNDFYDGTPISKGSVLPGLTGGQPTLQNVKSFRKKNWLPNNDLQICYQWNARSSQQASVSKVQYQPVSAHYRFNFTGLLPNTAAADDTWRYRITLIKLKNVPPPTNQVYNFQLPSTLGAYWHLCDADPNTRNSFSKRFHTVVADRWVTIKPDPAQNSEREVNVTINMSHRFPKSKPMKPDFLASTVAPLPQPVEFYWTNTPMTDLMWCIISSDAPTATTFSPITINCSRYLKWYDAHGVGS